MDFRRSGSRICAFILPLLLVTWANFPAEGQDKAEPKQKEPEFVLDKQLGVPIAKGQLLITLYADIDIEQLAPVFERLKAKFQVVDQRKDFGQYTIATDHERLHELRARLENHPYVASAGFNVLRGSSRVFDDPVFTPSDDDDDWNLHRINAPQAWDITKGGPTIAVIDSGSQVDHEDLVGRISLPFSMLTRASTMQSGVVEVLGPNGKLYPTPVRGHGTHVAITAAGTADNGIGTVGVAPDSPIMPIQVLGYQPQIKGIRGSDANIVAGMQRAINSGAAVLNMSLGSAPRKDLVKAWRTAKSPQEKQKYAIQMRKGMETILANYKPTLDLALRNNVIVVAAAGNENLPAEFAYLPLSKRVISVAATDNKDQRASFSNYGSYTDVSAPGVKIWSGWPLSGEKYKYQQGTSMAAPHVAGLVALMRAVDPDLTFADARDILGKTGRPLDTDQPIGPLVNARAALEEVRKRKGRPGLPTPPPLVRPVPKKPTKPQLPPVCINILRRPNPWTNPLVRRLIDLWLCIANPRLNPRVDVAVTWYFDRFGRLVNGRIVLTLRPPIWARYRYRYLWENCQRLDSTTHGTLYEFVVGTLKMETFAPAPPRVPEKFRPSPDDPKPPVGGTYDGGLASTKWQGTNGKADTLGIAFGENDTVTITRGGTTTEYTFLLDTFDNPTPIDLYPKDGEPVRGLIALVGYNEFLLRTDFDAKRPATVSRSDPATYVLRRTDVRVDAGNADGIRSNVLHRGYETTVAGLPNDGKNRDYVGTEFAVPKGYVVYDHALSADGKRLWLLLYNGAFGFKGMRWQLWSMRSDGTDAKQSTLVPLPEKAEGKFTVRSSRDGKVAWLHIPHTYPIHYGHVQRATIGQPAKVVADIAKVEGMKGGRYPLVISADGKVGYLLVWKGIARIDADGSVKLVVPLEKLLYQGGPPVQETVALAITPDGSHWAFSTMYDLPKEKKRVWAIVTGSGTKYRVLYTGKHPTQRITFSDDAKTILYELRGSDRSRHLFLHRDGITKPVMPDFMHLTTGRLSADGSTLYCMSDKYGTSTAYAPLLQDLETGRRRRAMSARLPVLWHTRIHLSEDGSRIAAQCGPGVAMLHDGVDPPEEHPQIESIRQRYEAGKLIVTVKVQSDEPLREVILSTLYNGYVDPVYILTESHNPANRFRFAYGLAPVKDRSGVYRAVLDLDGKHQYLDERYSFRITAVNATRNRSTHQDVAMLR